MARPRTRLIRWETSINGKVWKFCWMPIEQRLVVWENGKTRQLVISALQLADLANGQLSLF